MPCQASVSPFSALYKPGDAFSGLSRAPMAFLSTLLTILCPLALSSRRWQTMLKARQGPSSCVSMKKCLPILALHSLLLLLALSSPREPLPHLTVARAPFWASMRRARGWPQSARELLNATVYFAVERSAQDVPYTFVTFPSFL